MNNIWGLCRIGLQCIHRGQEHSRSFKQMNLECLGLCHSPIPLMVRSPCDFASALKYLFEMWITKHLFIAQHHKLLHLTLSQYGTIKFLHLGATGLGSKSETDDDTIRHSFARLAFSTFPSLLFIAFGDFSYGPQFQQVVSTQEILHRRLFPGVENHCDLPELDTGAVRADSGVYGFRSLERRDRRFEGFRERSRGVLEACPAELLFRKDF